MSLRFLTVAVSSPLETARRHPAGRATLGAKNWSWHGGRQALLPREEAGRGGRTLTSLSSVVGTTSARGVATRCVTERRKEPDEVHSCEDRRSKV